MAFKSNTSQQLSFCDTLWGFTPREKKALEKSWAKLFADEIFPAIDEERFSVLYSDKASRPNTPVNVIVGALIIKELFDLSDDEVVENLMLDPRYQYALHTTSFDEQPMSDKTLSRFRKRCYDYESKTGIDLYRDCVKDLSCKIAKLMGISDHVRRMDSMMVEANIRTLSRTELIYRCNAAMAIRINKEYPGKITEELSHYLDPNDFNRLFYLRRSSCTKETAAQLLCESDQLLGLCGPELSDTKEYTDFIRCLSEQTITEDGKRRMRTKEDGGMRSDFMHSPADPDATFCRKAGKDHVGYAVNIVESVGKNGSVVTDYQFERNTYSDSQFLKDHIGSLDNTDEKAVLITDGAYSGMDNSDLANEKNITLVTTALNGVRNPDILADFVLDDRNAVLECPMGNKPIKSSYDKTKDTYIATFNSDCCRNCPHKNECHAKINQNKARIKLTRKAHFRATTQRSIDSDKFMDYYRLRNGVETIPSILRRVYDIDHMPRGLIRGKFYTGSKILALNFRKYLAVDRDTGNYAQNPLIA